MKTQARPNMLEAFQAFGRIGLLSFGGPAAQIALMHKTLVEEKGWLTERQFLDALSFCMLLPGPEAMQLATYSGWRLHKIKGGLLAGLLFVLPGALVILALAAIYAHFGNVALVSVLFLGVKACVLVIVLEALLKISKRALLDRTAWTLAGIAFVAIFFLALPFPLIVAAAACFGFMRSSNNVDYVEPGKVTVSFHKTLATIFAGLVIWFLPLIILALSSNTPFLGDVALFFSKLAVVTFGGAYAVLAYMAQDVVVQFGWLSALEMMDGLGLAETTPGPLILVTQFVGFLAGFGEGGLSLALIAASVALWATFVPCFLWIFAGAPYIDWISAQPRLNAALKAITAAVVGVILNLSIWFALHVLFANVELIDGRFWQLWLPEWQSIDWRVVILALLSGFLLLKWYWSIPKVLSVSAALALAIHLMV